MDNDNLTKLQKIYYNIFSFEDFKFLHKDRFLGIADICDICLKLREIWNNGVYVGLYRYYICDNCFTKIINKLHNDHKVFHWISLARLDHDSTLNNLCPDILNVIQKKLI